jgi:PAN domain
MVTPPRCAGSDCAPGQHDRRRPASLPRARRRRAAATIAFAFIYLIFHNFLCRPAAAQVGFDRPGGDYITAVERSGDPSECAGHCDRDPRCRAWSFSYPATLGPTAVCHLKREVPRSVENPCCVSGVKGSAAIILRDPRVEFSIDRPGGDYRSFETSPSAAGRPCAVSCEEDQHCRAWTYVRPGYHGPAARCQLKDRLTRPRTEPCCVSGVVR